MLKINDTMIAQRSFDNSLWTEAEQIVAEHGASAVKRTRVMRRTSLLLGDRHAASRWDAIAWRVDHLVAGNPK